MTKQKIIIIGGGIVGSTAAYYLIKNGHEVSLIDHGKGQATSAAAGIICPWFSQRRNQDWYQLTSRGAAFYQQLMADLRADGLTQLPYQQRGSLIFKRRPQLLTKLMAMADERQQASPEMGDLRLVDQAGLTDLIPDLETDQGALFASGGGRVDGRQLLADLRRIFLADGGQFYQGQAQLEDLHHIRLDRELMAVDQIILATGAWLPQLLEPLGYQVDVRPQKGQLCQVILETVTDQWPACMLAGEIDILPFEGGKLVIGASHEDDQGFDLTVDMAKITQMKAQAAQWMPSLAQQPIQQIRVGTRAYTSDFLPFYGQVPAAPHLWVVSGLGSSGLTSGPFIAWQIAEQISGRQVDFEGKAFSPSKYIALK